MNKASVTSPHQTAKFLLPAQGLLQRKCACGNQSVAGGECAECAKKNSCLQRKLAIGASNDPFEQEADRIAEQMLTAPARHAFNSATPPRLQRLSAHPTARAVAPASVDRVLASPGRPLETALRQDMEQRFGHDFSDVRVHTDSVAEQSAQEVNAHAYTVSRNIVFGSGRFAPETALGRRLLAHELTHVVQQRSQAQHFVQREDEDTPDDPFAKWKPAKDMLLLIAGDDKLFIVPSGKAVFTPSEKALEAFQSSSAHYTQDLGTLFEVPATGASGTRVFRAGRRSAVIVDAGYDPTPGQSQRVVAVYVDEVMAIARQHGITKVSKMFPIHGHSDHAAGMPALATALNLKAENVIVPEAFANLAAVRKVVGVLSSTTDAGLVAKGFGAGWRPQAMPKDKGGPGDLYQGRMMVGELVFDFVALRSALKNAKAQPDLGSYLTRVTRRTDNLRVVLLGDLRGADLERIRIEMERGRSGMWSEFFSGVKTLSGFSHHVGRMDTGDIAGMMALLDATMLKEGKLRVVEQTNVNVASQARRDTLELAARLGIEVVYTDMPTGVPGSPTSAAGTTRGAVYTRGPAATAEPVIASALTQGQQRLESLAQSRLTIEQWRPWLEELNGKGKVDGLLTEINQSMEQLRQSVRRAAEAALNVRTETRPAGTAGARDYTAASGGVGSLYATALTAIPSQTAAERTLDAKALENLKSLRERDVESQPRSVAVYRAVTRGEYSDQAFSYMMSQLAPTTRDELIGRKAGVYGARVPRHVAFERVRTQYQFERSVLPGETMSVQHFSPMGRAGARGVGGVLLVAELWSSVGQPLYESHKISRQINVTKNLAPFLRRIGFWQEMGLNPSFQGVSDPVVGSPDYYSDPKTVIDKLKDDDLDAIYITKPGLSDADVLQLAVWLSMNVRNYDEYAELFEDSFQDAVRWRSSGSWDQASWDVRVGYYETEGSNHVVDSWYEHPKLTAMMRHFIPWLIANTRVLLQQATMGGERPSNLDALVGHMAGLPASAKAEAMPILRQRDPNVKLIVELPLVSAGDTWNRNTAKPELADLKVPGEPLFFELDRRGGGDDQEIKVTGANFNTYAAIRHLKMQRWSLGTRGNTLNALTARQGRNQEAWVWVDAVHLQPAGLTQQNTGMSPNRPTSPAPADSQPQQPKPKLNIQLGGARGGGDFSDIPVLRLPGPVGPKVFGPPLNQPGAEDKSRWIGPGASVPLPF